MRQIILSLAVVIITSNINTIKAQQSNKDTKINTAPSTKHNSPKIIKGTTSDGKKVLLKSDGTWKYANPLEYEEKQILPESASKALLEFSKISGSVETYIPFDQYQSLLIDFKGCVDQALRDLPDDSLKSELRDAVDRYDKANKIWHFEILTVQDKMDNWGKEASQALTDRFALWNENKLSLERAYKYSKQYEKQ
jgi:hypothetical protein